MNDLYKERKLADGYPGLAELAFRRYTETLRKGANEALDIRELVTWCNRLIDLGAQRSVLVLGCGPMPQSIKALLDEGYDVLGVEPVTSFVYSAREYLGREDRVLEGAAEKLPVADGSQNLVIVAEVLEHVDSPRKSLSEVYRVLSPGGAAVIYTTNRHKISMLGANGEFNIKFYNWFPSLLKECFVFHHLHYNPALANYTQRPAVHWYSYADLCTLGRDAGFAKFYSPLDLIHPSDQRVSKRPILKLLLKKMQTNPWLRFVALTQRGHAIIMVKR